MILIRRPKEIICIKNCYPYFTFKKVTRNPTNLMNMMDFCLRNILVFYPLPMVNGHSLNGRMFVYTKYLIFPH